MKPHRSRELPKPTAEIARKTQHRLHRAPGSPRHHPAGQINTQLERHPHWRRTFSAPTQGAALGVDDTPRLELRRPVSARSQAASQCGTSLTSQTPNSTAPQQQPSRRRPRQHLRPSPLPRTPLRHHHASQPCQTARVLQAALGGQNTTGIPGARIGETEWLGTSGSLTFDPRPNTNGSP